jgi:hypothetical protein
MAELSIRFHNRQRDGGRDGLRWHVGLEGDELLVVDLPESQAVETGLSTTELDDRLPSALQRFARGRLRNDEPVLDQVSWWTRPLVLAAEHFERI